MTFLHLSNKGLEVSKQSDGAFVHRYTTHLFRHVRVHMKRLGKSRASARDPYFLLYLGNNSRIAEEIFMKLYIGNFKRIMSVQSNFDYVGHLKNSAHCIFSL
jgi:hypothetical protein